LPTILWIGVFIGALALLVFSADRFVVYGEKVGLALDLPPLIIGVIILGFGTSLPELMSSIMGVLAGETQIVAGNVFGSNVTNIFLIAGLAGILGSGKEMKIDILTGEAAFLVGSLAIVTFSSFDGVFTWREGILALGLLVLYLIQSMKSEVEHLEEEEKPQLKWFHWLFLLASPVGIFYGADYTIQAVLAISSKISWLSPEIVAVTAVALGTSLPEVMVTIQSAGKGKSEIAMGNILGSNIFNLLAVMGIPSLVSNLEVPESLLSFTLPLLGVASFALLFILMDKKLTKYEGALLLIFYVFFLGKNYGLV
jgi:cation:H+ antiporter